MVVYTYADQYINCANGVQERITRMEAIIDLLITAATTGATSAHVEEYMLDDGQTKIKTLYRDTASIPKTIKDYQRLIQTLKQSCTGRVFNLIDGNVRMC